jgi:hypothetical protein
MPKALARGLDSVYLVKRHGAEAMALLCNTRHTSAMGVDAEYHSVVNISGLTARLDKPLHFVFQDLWKILASLTSLRMKEHPCSSQTDMMHDVILSEKSASRYHCDQYPVTTRIACTLLHDVKL